MTTLNKSARLHAAKSILTDAFAPRFAELRDRAIAEFQRQLGAAHPVFVKLYADKANRKYMYVNHRSRMLIAESNGSRLMGVPDYGSLEPKRPNRSYSCREDGHEALVLGDLVSTAMMESASVESGDPLALAHDDLWAEYLQAHQKLHALLNSYTSREKFQVDFPELAKHLPEIASKPKLPMVIVDEVKKDLAKLGIPAAQLKKGKAK